MTTQPPTILRLDPRALKVLAHPLRSRLLTALRLHGPATATALADDARHEHGRHQLSPAQARLGRSRGGDRWRSRPRAPMAGRDRDARLDRARRRRRSGRQGRDRLAPALLPARVRRSLRALAGRAGGVAARLAGRGRGELTSPSGCRPPGWPRSTPRSRRCTSAIERPRRRPPTRPIRARSPRPGLCPRLPARRGRTMTALDARERAPPLPDPHRAALAADRPAHPDHRRCWPSRAACR